MKKFILGFITGGIICAAVTGLAVEYAVTANPYPVLVDGQEVNIEGYNINDETYFKLRDVSAAVGGFEVGFEDNTIIIDTPTVCPEPTDAPTVISENTESLPDVEIETVDGVEYVDTWDIEKMLDSIGLGDYTFSTTQFFDGSDYSSPSLLENIPHHPDNNSLIPYSYYISNVVPVINSLR